MSEQQPTVSSFRVEKGKAKFSPVIAGDRKKPTQTAVPKTTLEVVQESPKRLDRKESAAAVASPAKELEPEAAPSPKVSVKVATTIQTVQSRREYGRTVIKAPTAVKKQTVKTAAALTEPVEVVRKPLFYYLKDRKEGTRMSTAGAPKPVAVASAATSGRNTPRPPSTVPSRSVSTVVAPQVRIVKGEIVVDEEATVVKPADDLDNQVLMDIVHDTGRHLTSHAFVKMGGPNRWKADETAKFYDALSMCGTDFSLMSMLFPNKTREQIKGKFRVEERTNPKKVETFLKKKTKFDTAWMDRVQNEKTEETAAQESKRGRPRQEFEGSPVPIPSIMSTPSRRSSLAGSLTGSPTKTRKTEPTSPTKMTKEHKTPAKETVTSPVKDTATSPTRSPRRKDLTTPAKSSPLKPVASPTKSSPRMRPVSKVQLSPEKTSPLRKSSRNK